MFKSVLNAFSVISENLKYIHPTVTFWQRQYVTSPETQAKSKNALKSQFLTIFVGPSSTLKTTESRTKNKHTRKNSKLI